MEEDKKEEVVVEKEETITTEEAEKPEEKSSEERDREFKAMHASKKFFEEKASKEESARKELEVKLNKIKEAGGKPTLDVEDYIDISASLEGLDQREKERLAKEHKLTGRSLTEIRKDEDFLLWQSAYRQDVEKKRLTLAPSGKQSESDRPRSLSQRLASASMADKEKILTEAGLYKTVRPRADRTIIGG